MPIQSSEYSPPPYTRKPETSTETSCITIDIPHSHSNRDENDEQRSAQLNTDHMRVPIGRERESEEQRNVRLTDQRKRSASNGSSETEALEGDKRPIDQEKRLALDRLDESEDQRHTPLTDQRRRSSTNRLSECERRKTARLTDRQMRTETMESVGEKSRTVNQNQITNMQREKRALEKKQQTLLNQYNWPAAIPTQTKEYCLQDFSNHMSMSVLRQSTCIICNIRASSGTMKECTLENIPHLEKLSCHKDLVELISRSQQTVQSENINYAIMFINL